MHKVRFLDPLPKVILLRHLGFLPVSKGLGGWDDLPRMLPKALGAAGKVADLVG